MNRDMSFIDNYTIRRVWFAPWKFAAYGWVSDAPYGMCVGRLSPILSTPVSVRDWIRANDSSLVEVEVAVW